MTEAEREAMNRADAFDQASSHYRGQIERLKREIAELKQQLEQAAKEKGALMAEFTAVMEEKPWNDAGEYTHLLICSGSRRKPPGEPGCVCPVGRSRKRLTALRLAVQPFVEVARHIVTALAPDLSVPEEDRSIYYDAYTVGLTAWSSGDWIAEAEIELGKLRGFIAAYDAKGER